MRQPHVRRRARIASMSLERLEGRELQSQLSLVATAQFGPAPGVTVELNPQPLPPRWQPVALNPQPLPPG